MSKAMKASGNLSYKEFLEELKKPMRICPVCKKAYEGYPALSRTDNKTEICPDCGTLEALAQFVENHIVDDISKLNK